MQLRLLFNCSMIILALSSSVMAQEKSEETYSYEPRIKFLRDLFNDGRNMSEIDPYEERIETERHDFTQSTKTVGRGVAQVEAGYSYYYKDNMSEIENSHATPEMLLRLGLTENIEFRLHWNYGWRFADEGTNEEGAQDLIWSIKLGMTDQDCWIPRSALEIRSSVPTGGSDWSTERVEFGLDYIYRWELTEGFSLYGSTGFGTDGLGEFSLIPEEQTKDRFIVWTQSVALGIDLTEKNTMYVEYFGLFSHALADDFAQNYFNIGIDHYINDNFVVDLRIGKGLSPDSDDFFSGIGGGYRF
ncbi:MAG: transporter [Gimesia sp.]|nr:transporter [Gimesia sp.]